MFENGPQNHSKIDSKMLPNRLQNGAEVKNNKSVKRSTLYLFWYIAGIRGVENPTNFFKRLCRKQNENQIRF